MAATIKIVSKEQWDILCDIFNSNGLVLVPEDALTQFPAEQQQRLRALDGECMAYDFGGESDFAIDVIYGPRSFAAMSLLGNSEEE